MHWKPADGNALLCLLLSIASKIRLLQILIKNKCCFLPKPLRRHLWIGHGGKWKHWVPHSFTAKSSENIPLPQASSFAFGTLRRNIATVSYYRLTWKQQLNVYGDTKFNKKVSVWKVFSFYYYHYYFFCVNCVHLAFDDNWTGASVHVMIFVDLSSVRWQLNGGLCIWSYK